MSLTLATVADALIEFILSLLRDPEAAAEFEQDPDQALAARGLQHVQPSDVAAVAPVIIERTHVVQVPVAKPVYVEHSSPVVREIQQVTTNFQWVDDRDSIVDQSVNQNIWAEGDVTQTFDNEAVLASGDDSVAAGGDADVDKTWDDSTTIEAGDDVNIGNQTDVEVIEDSFGEQADDSTTTDGSTVIVVDDSFDENDQQTSVDDSFIDSDSVTSSVVGDVAGTAAPEADGSAPAPEEEAVAPAPEEQPAPEQAVPAEQPLESLDAAVQYVGADVSGDDGAFGDVDLMVTDQGGDDDDF